MSGPDATVTHEPEVIEEHQPGHLVRRPAQPTQIKAWEASPLAELSEVEFEERLGLAKIERQRLQKIQLAVMTKGTDYGVIPGTNKPTLFQPGAQVLNKMARLVPSFVENARFADGVNQPHVHYSIQCALHIGSDDGPIVAWGVGSANSWERKYRYRKSERECPECKKTAIIKGKAEFGGGWLCFRKKDGCGAKYSDSDKRITSQVVGDVENPDPFDMDNTLIKMAKKRAYVDATLTAHAASGLFTQDVEDLPREYLNGGGSGGAKGSRNTTSPQPTAFPANGGVATAKQAKYIGTLCRQLDEESGEGTAKALFDGFFPGKEAKWSQLTSKEASTFIEALQKADGSQDPPEARGEPREDEVER